VKNSKTEKTFSVFEFFTKQTTLKAPLTLEHHILVSQNVPFTFYLYRYSQVVAAIRAAKDGQAAQLVLQEKPFWLSEKQSEVGVVTAVGTQCV
jgi:hypothetical protein